MDRSRNVLFESPIDFFAQQGSVWMRLSPQAAQDVCRAAAANGLVIARVEGGIWHAPGFEAHLDCIWDGIDPPISQAVADENNLAAAEFIQDEAASHSAFILTAPPVSGWPHKDKA